MKNVQWIKDGLSRSGKSQAALARHLGLNPSQVNRLLKGERNLMAHEVPVIEHFLDVSAPDHIKSFGDSGREYLDDQAPPPISGPCYASLATKDGVTIVYHGDQPVAAEPKPYHYAHMRGLYCFAAIGGPMEPRFKPGELVWINPHRPPRPGDDVVLIKKREQQHELYINLCELVSDTATTWTAKTHNPPSTHTFKKSEYEIQFVLPRD